MSGEKIFIRVCSKGTPVDVKPIRDIVYFERFGVSFEADLTKTGDYARADHFENKELSVMDNCVFFFATGKEIQKLKENGQPVQRFFMNKWVDE